MSRHGILLVFLFSAFSSLVFGKAAPTGPGRAFTENKGQIIDQNNQPNPGVLFILNTPGMNVQVRRGGFSYDIYSVDNSKRKNQKSTLQLKDHNLTGPRQMLPYLGLEADTTRTIYKFHRIDFDLLNSNPHCEIITSGPSSGYQNYYTTGTPVEGVRFVRSYKTVTYRNVYPGIDLEFLLDEQNAFKYNFVAYPGSDVSSIRIQIKGPETEISSMGSLMLKTSLGTVEEAIPSSFFRLNGKSAAVKCRFYRIGQDVFGFATDQVISPASTVTIDPVPGRLWATYYGGVGYEYDEYSGNLAVDHSGNPVMCGWTSSLYGIATTGAFQTIYMGGVDVFLTKFNGEGSRLWGTYFGGPSWEGEPQCAIDDTNNIYLSGTTNSETNIATPGAFMTTMIQGQDAFLAKFDSTGSRIWSTYYGGNDLDAYGVCAVDPNGYVYLCGETNSVTGISTPGSFQPDKSGSLDGFIVKFTAGGQRVWATYFGGPWLDYLLACFTDPSGNLVVSGCTSSLSGIASPGAYQTVIGNNPTGSIIYDGLMAKFTSSGQRLWATYYGGENDDVIYGMSLDNLGDIYCTGYTQSTAQISSAGSFQPSYEGITDGFLIKFSSAGQRLWGTYLGGTNQDLSYSLARDDSNFLFVAGSTQSANNIATPGAYQTNYSSGGNAFIMKFTPGGQRVWGTYYGDSCNGASCILYGDTLYLSGGTNAHQNIATPGSYQPAYSDSTDEFLVKFLDCYTPDHNGSVSGPAIVCQPLTGAVYTIPPMTYAAGYVWTVPSGATIVSGQNTTSVTVDFNAAAISGDITVRGVNGCGTGDPVALPIQTLAKPVPTIAGSDTSCAGLETTYTTEAGMSDYSWSVSAGGIITGGGTTNDNYAQVKWNATGSQWIKVRYTGINGCTAADILFNVDVHDGPPADISIVASANPICAGMPVTFTSVISNGGSSPVYQWKINANNASNASNAVFTYTPVNGDVVTCAMASSLACVSGSPAVSNAITMTVNQNLPVSLNISANPPGAVCAGTNVTFTANAVNAGNLALYQWKVNANNANNASNAVFTYTPVNGDVVTCEVTSSLACVSGSPATSNAITMTVNQNLPVSLNISANPAGAVCAGTNVTFTANAVNAGNLPLYQWKVNANNANNASNAVYTYVPSNGDLVSCVVTSSVSCITGNPATSPSILMTVITPSPVSVSVTASENPFCAGSSVTFTASAVNAGSTPGYQWKVNGINANNASNASYAYNANNGDVVTCVMTSNLNCVTSNPATSQPITMIARALPIVSFTSCFDTVTFLNAKPYRLKGGLPAGGQYSGPGVNSTTGFFTPSTTGTGLKTITYGYTNVYTCMNSATKTILVKPTPSFTCGSAFTDPRDNKAYQTILIGTQCWMNENLSYGTEIPDNTPQTDNCLPEKYLRNFSFLIFNSVYQWDELMHYETSTNTQGLCPPGWHIPTPAEWDVLLSNYSGPGQAGTWLKDKLLPNGFDSYQYGLLYQNNTWSFTGGDYAGSMYWTSAESGSDRAIARGLNQDNPGVSRYEGVKSNAFGTRCCKD